MSNFIHFFSIVVIFLLIRNARSFLQFKLWNVAYVRNMRKDHHQRKRKGSELFYWFYKLRILVDGWTMLRSQFCSIWWRTERVTWEPQRLNIKQYLRKLQTSETKFFCRAFKVVYIFHCFSFSFSICRWRLKAYPVHCFSFLELFKILLFISLLLLPHMDWSVFSLTIS